MPNLGPGVRQVDAAQDSEPLRAYAPFEWVPRVDLETWQRVVDQSESATFFHRPEWYQVFTRTFPATRLATTGIRLRGNRLAILPLLEWKRVRALPGVFWSGPSLTYGGWISETDLSPDETVGLTEWTLRRFANLSWRMNPMGDHAELIDRHATRADTTEVFPLHEMDSEEEILARIRPSARRQVRKAVRRGLEVRRAETWSDWESYLEIYRRATERRAQEGHATERRTGPTSRPYPAELFRNLYRLQSQNVILWIVTLDGRIVGGTLDFYHDRHCVEWHAAYDRDALCHGSRNFLTYRTMVDAWKRGLRWYDFNPSGGYEGTQRFKRTFGTSTLPAGIAEARSRIYRSDWIRALYHRLRSGGY